MPFASPVRDDIAFRAAALAIFDKAVPPNSRLNVRLIGFGVTNFCNAPDDGQPSLFEVAADADREKHERLSDALDILRSKGLLNRLGVAEK